MSLESVADAGLSLFKSSNFDSPPLSNAVSQQELLFPIGSNSAPGSLQKYAKPVGLTIDSITSSETIYGEKSSALVSVEVLDTYVQMAEKSGEDVLSMVSVKNTICMSTSTCNSIRHPWNFIFHKSFVPQPFGLGLNVYCTILLEAQHDSSLNLCWYS